MNMVKVFMLFVVAVVLAPWAAQAGGESGGPRCQDLVAHLSMMQNFGRMKVITGHFAQLNMYDCRVSCSQPKRRNERYPSGPTRVYRSCQASGVADFEYIRGESWGLYRRSIQMFRARVQGENIEVECKWDGDDVPHCGSRVM